MTQESSIINLQALAVRLSEGTGASVIQSEKFLLALFSGIEETLCADPQAHVLLEGIGTFSAPDSETGAILFIPTKELAEAVNAPFEMFDPIELDTEEDCRIASSDLPAPESNIPHREDMQDAGEPSDDVATEEQSGHLSEETVGEPSKLEEISEVSVELPEDEDNFAQMHTSVSEGEHVDEAVDDHKEEEQYIAPTPVPHAYRFAWLTAGIVIGGVIGWLAAALFYTRTPSPSATAEVESVEATIPQPDVPSEAVRTVAASSTEHEPQTDGIQRLDTVTAKRYITHMAKEYYGDRAYWVYIYEANAATLGHPERTLPGTVVRIPDISTLPIDPANPSDKASLRQARALAAEIYARFQ